MIIGKNCFEFRKNKAEVLIMAKKILGESEVEMKPLEFYQPPEKTKRK